MNINILLINALLYIAILLYFLRKKGLTIYTMLWFEFAIIAFLGYYTFEVGTYQFSFGPQRLSDLTMLPYLFVLFGYVIAFEPFRNLSTDLNTPIPYRSYTGPLLNLWIVAMTAFLILKIVESTITMAYGMGDYYNEHASEGITLFDYSDNIILKRINTVGNLLSVPLIPFVMAYCIQCWNRKEHTIKTIILTTLCFLPYIFGAAAGGSRTNFFFVALNILFFYSLYRNSIPTKVKKVVSIAAIGLVALMWSYAAIITEERFGKKYDDLATPILRYFGEPYPNVGFQYYGKVKEHTWGKRRFGGIIAPRDWDNANKMRDYWTKKSGVSAYWFCPYWLDMYIEFGEIGAFIFVILYAWIIKKLTGPKLTVYNMSYLFMYFRQIAASFRSLDWFGIGLIHMLVAMVVINYAIKKLYFTETPGTIHRKELSVE